MRKFLKHRWQALHIFFMLIQARFIFRNAHPDFGAAFLRLELLANEASAISGDNGVSTRFSDNATTLIHAMKYICKYAAEGNLDIYGNVVGLWWDWNGDVIARMRDGSKLLCGHIIYGVSTILSNLEDEQWYADNYERLRGNGNDDTATSL